MLKYTIYYTNDTCKTIECDDIQMAGDFILFITKPDKLIEIINKDFIRSVSLDALPPAEPHHLSISGTVHGYILGHGSIVQVLHENSESRIFVSNQSDEWLKSILGRKCIINMEVK